LAVAAFCTSASANGEESTDGSDEDEDEDDDDGADNILGSSLVLAALLFSAWNSKKPSRLASCRHDETGAVVMEE